MTTTTTTTSLPLRRSPAAVLLSRRALVPMPTSGGTPAAAQAAAGVTLLEADLVERGYLLSAPLRQALAALDAPTLTLVGATLLADVDAALGADRPHVPLFRSFPDRIPANTVAFYVDRLLAAWLQTEGAPCVLCGSVDQVHPVSPCAHLVCRTCFDGTTFSACPICHRRIDTADPFLRPAATRRAPNRTGDPARLRVLGLSADTEAELADELAGLLARPGALSPADLDDALVLLGTRSRTDLSWLPAQVPGRETKAHLLAWLLADPASHPVTGPAAAALTGTATDVLRVLAVRSGGDAGLVTPVRFAPVPRPLRRVLLGLLDRLDLDALTEDLHRHAAAWRHAGERLHPFEYAARYPTVAAAFAALRRTPLRADALGAVVRAAAAGTSTVALRGDTARATLFGARVEAALTAGDVTAAVALLRTRPGELLRRLDHLLRLAAGDPAATERVLAALPDAAATAAPAVLLSTLGQLRTRDAQGPRRVFFPKGGSAKAHVVPEDRPVLDPELVARVGTILTGAVLDRAAAQPPVATALLDAGLDTVMAPFTERTASRSLVTLPRGSALPLPAGRTTRLFLHWMEGTVAPVDLDLSVALFDENWAHVGTCDYTNLRFAGTAAVHSGDLTSAPAPLGASEFIDLDLPALAAAGARYAVTVVFSYNNVAFEDMAEAFAGFMTLPDAGSGPVFQPRAVEQRFDLTGRARASVPMVLDLAEGTARWVDVVRGVTGTGHAVHRHADDLAVLGQALTDLFAGRARVSLGELATWHAAARADTVLVRDAEGALHRFTRRAEEDRPEFAARVATRGAGGTADGAASAQDAAGAELAFLLRGDLALPAGAQAYALYPGSLDATAVRLLAAADLAAALG